MLQPHNSLMMLFSSSNLRFPFRLPHHLTDVSSVLLLNEKSRYIPLSSSLGLLTPRLVLLSRGTVVGPAAVAVGGPWPGSGAKGVLEVAAAFAAAGVGIL